MHHDILHCFPCASAPAQTTHHIICQQIRAMHRSPTVSLHVTRRPQIAHCKIPLSTLPSRFRNIISANATSSLRQLAALIFRHIISLVISNFQNPPIPCTIRPPTLSQPVIPRYTTLHSTRSACRPTCLYFCRPLSSVANRASL